MWSYYGAKTNIIHLYPPPKYGTIIESFAGTARYALRYWERDIILVDKYEVIVKIWKWLQQCSPKDIERLPEVKAGENINDKQFDCEEARLLAGFCIGFGFHHPRQIATVRLRDRPNHLGFRYKQIASQLFKIKHWKIIHGCYTELENQEATWFIDAPYQFGGHVYPRSSKQIDFVQLGNWCRERKGQVIVCENNKADWMDFKPFVDQNVRTGKHREVIWLNSLNEYSAEQIDLFDNLEKEKR